jgi:hypothetical protein
MREGMEFSSSPTGEYDARSTMGARAMSVLCTRVEMDVHFFFFIKK